MPNYPKNHGGPDNGGTRAFFDAADAGMLWPWDWSPELQWEARISYRDLAGPHATQLATVSIGEADFVTGRLTITISGGGLVSPVVVTADAAVADDFEDLADLAAAAVDDLVATTLGGVVTSSTSTVAGDVSIFFVAGIARVTVTATYTPAQQTTVTWGGTLVDGLYSINIVSDEPEIDVTVPNDRAAATPVDAAAMAAAFQTAAAALVATTLENVLVSAADDGAVNTLIFEPGVEATVTATVTNNTTHTFGGTPTDGDYVTRFDHASLPGGSLTITTTRAADSPIDDTALADAFEADVEARALLFPFLVNADNTAGANTITFYDGITGMNVVAVSAPDPGTLVVADPTVVVADATPAGPEITVSYGATIALNSLGSPGRFPHHVWRLEVALEVVTAFGATRTIVVGDADATDALLGSTPVTLNSTGRTLSIAADTQHADRYEGTLVPTATIVLGASNVPTQGLAFVQITYAPHVSMTATAAA